MSISVFIITQGRLEKFKGCLRSVLKALPEDGECNILINGRHVETFEWLRLITDKRISYWWLPEECRAKARNRAFEISRNDIIYFLDDDVVIPPDLFKRALWWFKTNPYLAVLGGPNLTPKNSPAQEKFMGSLLSSPIVTPRVYARYIQRDKPFRATEQELILCNLAVKKSHLKEIRFQENIASNEENLLLYQCHKAGLYCLHDPQLFVYHHRRAHLWGFLNQIYSYGVGRAQQTLRAPKSSHGIYLLPSLLLIWTFLGWKVSAVLWGASLIAHQVVSLYAGIQSRELRSMGLGWQLWVAPVSLAVHLAYGAGFWVGFFSSLKPAIRMFPPKIKPLYRFNPT